MKRTFITVNKAAEKYGITNTTIRNLIKAKVLSVRKLKNIERVCEQDLQAYQDRFYEVVDAERTIDSYIEDLKAKECELAQLNLDAKERIEMRRYDLANIDMFPKRIEAIKELLVRVIELYCKDMTARDTELLIGVLQTGDLSKFAEANNITRSRTGQLWYRALRRLSSIKSEIERLNEENERLSNEMFVLLRDNCELKKRIECLKSGADYSGNILPSVDMKIAVNLNKRLQDEDLTVRTINCLRAAEIITARDLVQFERKRLLTFRNFGKKSLLELDEWLERNGLCYGTDVSMYPKF